VSVPIPQPRDPLPEGEAKVAAVREMFDTIAPRYDLVNRVMTFRMDVGWRRAAVASLGLAKGATVVDLASGTGDLCVELAARHYWPVSVDLSFGMLAADRSGVPRVQADVLQLPLAAGAVAGATCGFALRNLVALEPFFAELARVVMAGGRVALLEVATPPNPLLRAGHRAYFGSVVPVVGGLLSNPAAYRYLPRSVAYLPEPAQLLALLAAAGFTDVDRRLLSAGISQLITATRR
jgi:demethylmenaquinone methyltransferase/2-methoxy-6-polyprenyl-1,4-benzoquinol methylase